jgi:uncharacterized protein (TIGR00255 family)
MTGFGAASVSRRDLQVRVEVRTVNHRFLAFKTRLPIVLSSREPQVEQLARGHFERGFVHIDVQCSSAAVVGAPIIDAQVAAVYARALRRLAGEIGLTEEPTLATLLSLPGVLVDPSERPGESDALFARVQELLGKALAAAVKAREREGRALLRDLQRRRRGLLKLTQRIRARAPVVVVDYRRRLASRLSELLAESAQAIAGDGVAREVALFAERADVTEELTRLEAHLVELDRLLRAGGSMGRQLDFLLQELNREVITIGAKANDAAISHEVVAMKGELEKIREQAQNLE